MKRKRYEKDLPKKLYLFFSGFKEGGAPSFLKFARSIGATLEDIERFKEQKEFKRAYDECQAIRRDYLIDCALLKKFDSSFTKFLLEKEGFSEDTTEDGFILTVKVDNDDGSA